MNNTLLRDFIKNYLIDRVAINDSYKQVEDNNIKNKLIKICIAR